MKPSHFISFASSHPQCRTRAFQRFAENTIRDFLTTLKLKNVEVALSFVTDKEMQKINRTHRQKNKPTDVLSFPLAQMPNGDGIRALGDIVISYDTAQSRVGVSSAKIRREIALYLAHGLLHLLGYDHELGPKEAQKMAKLEVKLLGHAGMLS